jgi:hypothetical protein
MVLVNLQTPNSTLGYDDVNDWSVEYSDDKEIDKASFVIGEEIAINPGNEIKFYDDDDVLQFAGICKERNPLSGDQVGLVELICYTYDIELTEQTVTEVFQSIALETFIQNIVEGYSSLTFATTLSTGITIDYYLADRKYAWDVIKDILDRSPDLTYQINYTTKVFNLIQRGGTLSSITLENGVNCVFETGWKATSDKQVTKLNLIGGKETRNGFSESFSGTGAQTDFTTTHIFNNIKVVVGGVEKTLQVTGQNTGDFTVVPKDKIITFLSAPVSGTDNIIATYDYEIPIDLTGVEADYSLVAQYGTIEKSIVRNHLKSTDDAIDYAYEYVNRWARPVYSNKARIVSTLDASQVKPGDKIYVIDSLHTIEGVTIADYYLISAVYFTLDGLEIEVGEPRSEVVDFIKELKYEIQQLEQNNINVSISNKVQTVSNSATITYTTQIVSLTRRTWNADTFYLLEDGAAARNQMLDSGLGPIMRDTGGYTDEPLTTTYLTTESDDILTTESGDILLVE